MVRIDETRCVGCGICADVCPEGIEIVGGKARIKNENAECLKDAANACPRGAILLDTNIDFNENYGQGRGMGSGRGRGLGIGPRDGRGQGRGGGGRGRGR